MATAAADKPKLVTVPPDATTQASYSGTPRGPDGSSMPDDYAPKMSNPVTRMETFEEMGQADDQVRTGLEARRQEISAANWQLATASDDPKYVEQLEFAEDAIYPFLDTLLRQLAGALQYGFAAVEPVYAWGDRAPFASVTRGKVNRAAKSGTAQRIWIRKIAHIRQTSVQTFRIAGPNDPAGLLPGDLQTIDQHVYDGASFRQRRVPGDKPLLWVYNKQGDDHWGVPPTRHCYKAWTFKSQIEKLNILHLDKFGVGTPVLEEGEGWQQADRDRAATMLMNWRAGAKNYVIFGKNGKLDIKSANGDIAGGMLEFVKYYNLAIAKTMLTQLTELGSTDTGTRALGETFYDQLSGITQGDCEELANLINNRLIVPLINWNFGEQEFYPTFAPSQRVRRGSGVPTVLQGLISAGVLHPTPEDEAWLRDVLELPSIDLDELKAKQAERDATAQQIADAANAAGGQTPGGGGSAAERLQPNRSAPPARIAAARSRHDHGRTIALAAQLADGAPAPATYAETSWRTPDFSAWEHGVLRPDMLSRDLDMQTTRTASEVQDVLREIDVSLTEQVAALAAQGASSLSAGVRSIAVSDALRKKLRKVLLTAAMRARDYGATSVVNEIERQIGPGALGPTRAPSFTMRHQVRELVSEANQTPADLHLLAEVDRAVEDEIDRREGSARRAARDLLAMAATATAAALGALASSATKEALAGLSPYRTEDNVAGTINVGFGIGRSETAQEIANGGGGAGDSGIRDANGNTIGIVAKVYSAVMDMGTCNECAKWDGAEFPIDYPEDFTGVQAPNPRCDGTIARCRCVWIYITDRESVPLVPASKGPQPIRRAA